MKRFLTLILLVIIFASCKKESGIIIEPADNNFISSDTVVNGQKFGLATGTRGMDLYAKIQELKFNQKVGFLSVAGNIFTNLETLGTKIPLYTSIFLDEKVATKTGIQISFAEGKVKSIWTSGGTELSKWPVGNNVAAAIIINDKVEDLYAKLVNIKSMSSFSSKFERITIATKNINTAYDPQMSLSPQWNLVVDLGDRKFANMILNFKDGILISIYTNVYQRGAY